jgi:eukaryotic-like serine/threonine-protein kinase
MQNTGCNPRTIEHFLAEQLSGEEQAAFEDHLENCLSCRLRLEETAADPSWWQEAQGYLGSTGADPSESLSSGEQPAGTGEGVLPAPLGGLRGYLAPTDDPRMLGRLGSYEIAGIVGCGGMGVVLKGFDAALLRYVAIKVLSPQLASNGAARQRFAREAQAAAGVVHENVMAIHAVAEANGLPYFVMPYVRGPSLEKLLRQKGALPVEDVLRIGRQVAAGLAAAHAQGLVHRDIKPANILLEDGAGCVKITDFGLARAVDDASLTRSGVIAGTPQYMSPEQTRGESIDHRSDLFSLGSLLYTVCAGRPPFRAETVYGILRRISEDDPRSLRELSPSTPDWLVNLIAKLHCKAPRERFQSASEVQALLEGCLAHLRRPEAIPLPEAVTALGKRAWTKRRLASWAAVSALALALGAGAIQRWIPLRSVFTPAPLTAGSPREPDNPGEGIQQLLADETSLAGSVGEIRHDAERLESDLRQRSVPGYGDPADSVLQEVQQRLDRLQRELNAESPQGKH